MRPKKKILIIDANEERRGVLAYTLEVKGFRTYQAAGVGHARKVTLPAEPEIDLILAYWPLPADEFSAFCQAEGARILTVVGHEDKSCAEQPQIENPSIEALIHQIIVSTRRKRGPKKKVQQLTAA